MKHNVPIHEIMTADPIAVHEKQKLSEVHRIIVERKIHHVPVVSGRRLVGLISATDLLRMSWGDVNKQDPRQVDVLLDTLAIRDVMQEDIVTMRRNETVRRAAELLVQGDFSVQALAAPSCVAAFVSPSAQPAHCATTL